MECKYRHRLTGINYCYRECYYCTFEQEKECKVKHPEYFKEEKPKHPFAITCRRCGSDNIKVIAHEHRDLGIECLDCGLFLNCGNYYTKEYDYSDMCEF